MLQKFKKETLAQVFSCEFCEISKNTFFAEHLQWLLLFFIKFYNGCKKLSQKRFEDIWVEKDRSQSVVLQLSSTKHLMFHINEFKRFQFAFGIDIDRFHFISNYFTQVIDKSLIKEFELSLIHAHSYFHNTISH